MNQIHEPVIVLIDRQPRQSVPLTENEPARRAGLAPAKHRLPELNGALDTRAEELRIEGLLGLPKN